MLKIVVLASTIGIGTCFAQADRAAVTGTITDQSHSALSTAHITVVYPATSLRRETQSSSSGVYEIAGLPGARRIPSFPVAFGPSPNVYAYYRGAILRNLYRIPIP